MKLVNLLPKSKQKDFQYEIMYHSLVVFITVNAITLVMVFLAQFAAHMYIAQSIAQYDQKIFNLKLITDKQENAELKKQIQEVNAVIADYNKVATEIPLWSNVLHDFGSNVPEGVKLQTFNADTTLLKIDIAGIAETREQVIKLHENISNDDAHFTNIDYPLENISKPVDVPFHFTFFIKPEALKQ